MGRCRLKRSVTMMIFRPEILAHKRCMGSVAFMPLVQGKDGGSAIRPGDTATYEAAPGPAVENGFHSHESHRCGKRV